MAAAQYYGFTQHQAPEKLLLTRKPSKIILVEKQIKWFRVNHLSALIW
jgi:hypothetical protein